MKRKRKRIAPPVIIKMGKGRKKRGIGPRKEEEKSLSTSLAINNGEKEKRAHTKEFCVKGKKNSRKRQEEYGRILNRIRNRGSHDFHVKRTG